MDWLKNNYFTTAIKADCYTQTVFPHGGYNAKPSLRHRRLQNEWQLSRHVLRPEVALPYQNNLKIHR